VLLRLIVGTKVYLITLYSHIFMQNITLDYAP